MLLKDNVALITGAAAGIGRETALRFAAEGARVAVADRDRASGEAVVAEIIAAGGAAVFTPLDLADHASIEVAVAAVVTQYGRIDLLVNNAGVTRRIGIFDLTPADWDWIHDINVKGTFFCLQAVARQMRIQGGGRIVNLASIAGKGLRGASNVSYSASKGAIIAMTRAAACDLGAFNIQVNTVCPGPTLTPMTERVAAETPGFLDSRTREAALGRLSRPEDIAGSILFLCSGLAGNITGQSINVDGGIVWD